MSEFHLDQKDRRLLAGLDRNARSPTSLLAKKVALSKQAAAYRLERLQKNGVISGFLTIINLPLLGYTGFQLYLKLRSAPRKKEEALVTYALNHPRVIWGIRCTGSWDFLILFAEHSVKEFDSDLKALMREFSPFIATTAFSVYTSWRHLNHKYITGEEPAIRFLRESKTAEPIDELDRKILSIISTNCRASLLELAARTKIPASTVAYRLKELQKRRIIVGFMPHLDFNKTGYQYFHVILKLRPNVTDERKSQFLRFFEFHPNIVYIEECFGEADLELEAHFRNAIELREFLVGIRGRFGEALESDESVLAFDVIKYNYFPFKT
ncbi:MAG: Lrp/AsnC family transcriptional regulator [Candidatus Micrarchaeota archaeon]